MKHSRLTRLAASLWAAVPAVVLAQSEPVIVQAESGAVGSAFTTSTQDGVTYISISPTVAGGNPTDAARVATYTVTFPAAGTYELYARLRVGPDSFNDDSFFYGNGFGEQAVSADNSADGGWILANGLGNAVGFTLPTDKVTGGGLALNNIWKWVKLSAYDGGEPPVAGFGVPEGALTQTLQIGGREDGLDIDQLAFGPVGVFYTVNDLDNQLPGSTEPPPPPFVPSGPPIATGQPKFLGSAWSPPQDTGFTAYWNQVTPENAGKWGSVEGTRDEMNWEQLDTAYELAKSNGFKFRLHVLVWGNQQPAWIETLPPEEQLVEIEEWFAALAARYPEIDWVEVVNEPLHDPPNQPGNGGGNYIEALGGTGATGWDWILNAFRLARKYFGDTPLMINEFSVTNTPADMDRYIEIIELLQAEHLIDAVGVQGHAFSTRPNIPVETHLANLDKLAATGLPIQVTELDIDGPTDEIQLADYQRIFPMFWEHPGVTGITLWGFRPGHWRSAQGAYIVLDNGAERPAMIWLQEYVQDNAPVVQSGQSFEVSESAVGGTTFGTVLALDADAGQTLNGWQITGGSGAALFDIDATTGALSVAPEAILDFESAVSYTLTVSVHDGFRRSAEETVSVHVLNENDNAPAVDEGQRLRIDGGKRHVIGKVTATDPDDANEPGFTTLQSWQLTGGNGAGIFAIDAATGAVRIVKPLKIDFRRHRYTLEVSVSDGAHTSAIEEVSVSIPHNVKICLKGHSLTVPKLLAPLLLRWDATLGRCTSRGRGHH